MTENERECEWPECPVVAPKEEMHKRGESWWCQEHYKDVLVQERADLLQQLQEVEDELHELHVGSDARECVRARLTFNEISLITSALTWMNDRERTNPPRNQSPEAEARSALMEKLRDARDTRGLPTKEAR